MKKFAVVLLIIGLVLFGTSHYAINYVEHHKKLATVNMLLNATGNPPVSPKMVQQLLNTGITFMGRTYTINDLVRDGITVFGHNVKLTDLMKQKSDSLMSKLKINVGLPVYAWSGELIIASYGLMGVGILGLLFFPGSKKRRKN